MLVSGIVVVIVLVAQLCPTVCYPMNYSPSGSSVRGILQARLLEWVAMPSSRGSSHPGIEPGSLMSAAPLAPSGKPIKQLGFNFYKFEKEKMCLRLVSSIHCLSKSPPEPG